MNDNSGIKKRVVVLFVLTVTLFVGFYQIAMGLVALGIPTPGIALIIIRLLSTVGGLVESVRLIIRKDVKMGVTFVVLNGLALLVQLSSLVP